MIVELLNYTPLCVAVKAIRTCWQSQDKSDNMGEKDISLIERVANKFKHASTIEHLNYTFDIDGVSRALLQELARHRIASYSVKSTRYTLKELKNTELLNKYNEFDKETMSKFVVFTDDSKVDTAIAISLMNLQEIIIDGTSNDIAKYCIPEAYKTSLVWTINARSLQNFLALRSSKDALWEIRELALEVYKQLPEDHKFLFKDFIKDTNENK
jgi:thymidylate synthase (FAD)